MGNIQSIQNALIAINETVFQDLCDSFLVSINRDYTAFSRTGSQVGKQKTKKGTPDSCFWQKNGKFVFVEYSTNVTSGVSKLISDVEKCLDKSKTGISIDDISKIILFFNFNLKPDEIKNVSEILVGTGIELELYPLDTLALELSINHRNIAHEFLNVPLDSGQVVSIDQFIKEYDKASKGIATPLNNPFVHRENELKKLNDYIAKENLVILSGAPGVGKTKLALEAIKGFVKDNISYSVYCISYKHASLIEDLNQYLHQDEDYILFVDDANRIDSLGQVLGFYKSQRNGNLKILMTVRDYAFHSVKRSLAESKFVSYSINKLTDEHIIDIIKSEPFNIQNYRYQREIIRVAEGNPRLAIMAALVAIEKQSLQVFHDSSDLFERYFSTFINDEGEFADSINIRILGLIAFFYALPYKDKESIIPILDAFELIYNDFIEHIDRLDRLELVEIQYDNVKIPEQNLSTYFFYKAFIKEGLLSFETLLKGYYNKQKARFHDSIIPANNTFGYDNVVTRIKPALKKYLDSINEDKDTALDFLSVFCVYLQEEALGFLYNMIAGIPKINVSPTEIYYVKGDYLFKRDSIIELLGDLFRTHTYLKDFIELSFEYIRKQPYRFSELIDKIKDALTFKPFDADYGFDRQRTLYEVLIKGVNQKDIIYTKAFYELSKTFLLFQFEQTEPWHNHSFSFYHYPLPCNNFIKDLRKEIWECLNSNYSDEVYSILENYLHNTHDVVKDIMEHEMPFVCSIIENHLNPDSLIHCKYVQELIRCYKRNAIKSSDLEELSRIYTSRIYEMYLKVSWDRLRDKDCFQYDDYEEYTKLKENEIRESFVFENKQEVDSFYNDFISIVKTENESNRYSYEKVLDIIVVTTFQNHFNLGVYFLEIIIRRNLIGYIPNKVFEVALTTEAKADDLWSLIQCDVNVGSKEAWEMSFYHYIPNSLVCDKYIQGVKQTISNWNSTRFLNLNSLQKFFVADSNLLNDVFEIIAQKDETQNFHILEYDLKEIFSNVLGVNIELAKRVYIRQAIAQHHFDYKKDILLIILAKDSRFLIDYVDALYFNNSTESKLDSNSVLSIVWDIDNSEEILKEIFKKYHKSRPYSSNEHFGNSFFVNLSKENEERAGKFLLDYCRENYDDVNIMNFIIDITRISMKGYYSQVLLLYISITQDKEMFSKIHWCINEGAYVGDVIIGDIEAAKWTNVLSVVNQSDIGYKLIPIKQYINSRIESYQRYAEQERKSKFVDTEY